MHTALSQTAPLFPFEMHDAAYHKPATTPAVGLCERDATYAAPRMISSVVSEAGLGRFVYLVGQSGKRYVFSSITLEQAALYENAVFACAKAGSENVSLGVCAKNISRHGPMLYVHLLDDEVGEPQKAIQDLETTLALS